MGLGPSSTGWADLGSGIGRPWPRGPRRRRSVVRARSGGQRIRTAASPRRDHSPARDRDRWRARGRCSRCDHRDVRARPVADPDDPAHDGRSADAQFVEGSSAAAARAFVRRLTRTDRRVDIRSGRPGAHHRALPHRQVALSRRNWPSDSIRSSGSPDGWPPRTTGPTSSGWSSTRPSAPCEPTRRRSGSCATTSSRWRPGPVSRTSWPGGCRSSAATRAGSARSCAPGTSLPIRTCVAKPSTHGSRMTEAFEVAGHLIAPLIHHDRVLGALSAVTREPRAWTSGDVAFITTLATHAAIALANAELFEQTEARAAQLEVLQAASARMSRDEHGRRGRPDGRRGDAPDHRLPQRPRLPRRAARPGRPDRVRGAGRSLRAHRHAAPHLQARRRVHGLGRAARRADHRPGREPRSRAGRRSPGPTTSTNRCWSCRCATTGSTIGVITLSKLGLDGFGPDDQRLLTILADQAATAIELQAPADTHAGSWPGSCAPARHER